ncbi:translation initiation factor IF-2 subunit beta [Candidatus Woesearchaeota archaeon]|nr:translation initiation factor IF-2 subunit beta [Candidatus Woesearchaeota archaeon]
MGLEYPVTHRDSDARKDHAVKEQVPRTVLCLDRIKYRFKHHKYFVTAVRFKKVSLKTIKTSNFKNRHLFQEDMDYKSMLKRAKENLPEAVIAKERFEIPKVKGHIQGNKTIISNFVQIAQYLHRPVDHMLKYILKELATPGELKPNKTLMMGAKVSASKINEKIRLYADQFVLCGECGKPDTKIVKEDNVYYMRCLACGAKNPIRARFK